jgi:two-component system nitrate/nitrite response regulator NarL
VSAIRRLWPHSKIILVYSQASQADLWKLLATEINGCVPLFASDTLIGTLNTIATQYVRVMIALASKTPGIPTPQREGIRQVDIQPSTLQSRCVENEAMPNGTRRERPNLSQREIRVLNGLVKGHANKVIARTCDLTEAAVKVHIKSILRKIRLGNRTQAAVWALENGYPTSDSSEASVETDLGSNRRSQHPGGHQIGAL